MKKLIKKSIIFIFICFIIYILFTILSNNSGSYGDMLVYLIFIILQIIGYFIYTYKDKNIKTINKVIIKSLFLMLLIFIIPGLGQGIGKYIRNNGVSITIDYIKQIKFSKKLEDSNIYNKIVENEKIKIYIDNKGNNIYFYNEIVKFDIFQSIEGKYIQKIQKGEILKDVSFNISEIKQYSKYNEKLEDNKYKELYVLLEDRSGVGFYIPHIYLIDKYEEIYKVDGYKYDLISEIKYLLGIFNLNKEYYNSNSYYD